MKLVGVRITGILSLTVVLVLNSTPDSPK